MRWRLFQTPQVSSRKLDNPVVRNLSTMSFTWRTIKILSGELELLYLVMNGSIHYWKRLKWLNDINGYLKRNRINQDKIRVMALDLKSSSLISPTKFILSEYFPFDPSLPWGNEKIPFMKSFVLRQVNETDEPEKENVSMKLSRLRFLFHC